MPTRTAKTKPKPAARKPAAKNRAKPAPSGSIPKGSQAASMKAKRDQQIRKLTMQADMMAMQLDLKAGKALPVDLVEQEITVANGIVRDRFKLFHKTLARKLAGLTEKEMEPVIQADTEAILRQLCQEIDAAPP